MVNGWFKLCIFGLLFGVLLSGVPVSAASMGEYRQLAIAPHLHSRFSDGVHRISRIAAMARAAGYQGIWITDHTDVSWELPVLGTTVGYHKNSLREKGIREYLAACRVVQKRNPDVIVIPGFEASPYYFWSSTEQRLTNHGWMKHLLVAGIEDADLFRRLPITAYHNSPHRPAFADHGETPYLDFTRAVHEMGGVAFLAHPQVKQDQRMFRNIYAQVNPYAESLLSVPLSAGFAVHRWDEPLVKVGGIWDQALMEYCAGKRPIMPRVMTEIDFHRGEFQSSATLWMLTPRDLPADPNAGKRAILDALQAGRYYATNASPEAMRLVTFSAVGSQGETAVMGQAVAAGGPVVLSYSIAVQNPIEWVYLIRNGAVVYRSADVSGSWTDEEAARTVAPGYYRLAVKGQGKQFLLTNPIYVIPVGENGNSDNASTGK